MAVPIVYDGVRKSWLVILFLIGMLAGAAAFYGYARLTYKPRQWSTYMTDWLNAGNELAVDYLDVAQKQWCAVAIKRPANGSDLAKTDCIQ